MAGKDKWYTYMEGGGKKYILSGPFSNEQKATDDLQRVKSVVNGMKNKPSFIRYWGVANSDKSLEVNPFTQAEQLG